MAKDLFSSLWKNRRKLAGMQAFHAYVYAMACHALYNYYDHSLVREKYDAEQLWKPIQTENMEERLFADELQLFIHRWMKRLPPGGGQIFRMSRVEGLSNEEIAVRLGISKGTVENQLTVTLAELRKMLKLFIFLFCN